MIKTIVKSSRPPLLPHAIMAILVALIGGSLTLLSGCTPAGQQDPAAKARLDATSGTITYPISQYRLSAADNAVLLKAREVIIGKCLERKGLARPPSTSLGNSLGDRPYGLWDVQSAQRYGFGSAALAAAQGDGDGQAADPSGAAAYSECARSEAAELDGLLPPEGDPSRKLVSDKVRADAYEKASGTQEWKQARQEYWDALTRAGLTPNRSGAGWASVEAGTFELADKQREIQIATTEARCNNEVNLTQRLADLEASFQTPLIAKNEAALNEEKKANAALVARGRDVVARG